MTVSQKAAVSLLISVAVFAVIAISAFTGLFKVVETRFYDAALAKSFARETTSDAKLIEEFFADLERSFSQSLNEPAVRRSFLPNQSATDIFDRSRIYGTLLESLGGLQSIRFVDLNGSRIHFSTYAPDILNQDRLSVSYRNYNQDSQNLPFDRVQASATESFKLIMDSSGDRIIFSYPFFDSLDVYRGTALFSLSVRAVAERLINENKLKIGEDVSITSAPPGIVTGSPGTSKEEILNKVSSIWNDGIMSMTTFESDTGTTLALISAKIAQSFFYGRLIDEKIFAFPQPMRIILLLSIFLTLYLAIFLFFNLRQDPLIVVQNRLKNLQITLVEQYYERKNEIDWERWSRELEQRREDIRAEVKHGLKISAPDAEKDIDNLIDKSWDELIAAIGGHRKPESSGGGSFDEEKLQSILNKVLQALPAAGAAASNPAAYSSENLAMSPSRKLTTVSPVTFEPEEEEIEEMESLDDADDVETLDEVEEMESLDDTEGDGAVDGTLEELEDIAETEALEAAQAFEEAEDLEELQEAGATQEDYSAFGEIAEEEESTEERHQSVEMEIDKVASHIEFDVATSSSEGDDVEDILGTELEIFSPFASHAFFMADGEMQSKDEEPETNASLDTEDEKKNRGRKRLGGKNLKKKDNLTKTAQLGTGGLLARSLIYADGIDAEPLTEIYNDTGNPLYTPFGFGDNAEPEMLAGSLGLLATASTFREGTIEDVIIERDGVNFINQAAFNMGEETENSLDLNFKELVDSVIG